ARDAERFRSPRRLEDDVAGTLEGLARESANRLLVLDEEERLPSARRNLLDGRSGSLFRSIDARKIDPDLGSLARLAHHLDAAAALADDSVDGRKAEP